MPNAKTLSRYALTTAMVGMGALHFVADDIFVQIMPKALPWPMELVWISGVFEIALGLGLIPEATRRLAGYGLVALYLAVFPANIYMAMANVQVQGLPSWVTQPSPLALWLRLPMQAAFIWWALSASKPQQSPSTQS